VRPGHVGFAGGRSHRPWRDGRQERVGAGQPLIDLAPETVAVVKASGDASVGGVVPRLIGASSSAAIAMSFARLHGYRSYRGAVTNSFRRTWSSQLTCNGTGARAIATRDAADVRSIPEGQAPSRQSAVTLDSTDAIIKGRAASPREAPGHQRTGGSSESRWLAPSTRSLRAVITRPDTLSLESGDRDAK
jgi:hypothetical protein